MTTTGPPWDHHGTLAADWPRASHLCHLPAPPWPRSVALHEPLAWPQQALGQRAVATGRFGSQEGEQARDIGMGAPCSTRVPEPCATARGCDTPRAPREKTLDTPGPPPNATAPNPAGSGTASSLVMATRSSLPFLHTGSPRRAELFTATNPPWYSHGGEKAGGWGRRLALLEISPRPPACSGHDGNARAGHACTRSQRSRRRGGEPQLRPEALAARMKKTSRDTTPVTSSRPCRAFPRLGDQTHQARKPGAASSSRTPCSSVLGVGGTKQHQGWGSPRVLSPRSAPRMEQRCWEGNLRADLKLGCGQKHTGEPQGGGCPPEGMGPPHAAWLRR